MLQPYYPKRNSLSSVSMHEISSNQKVSSLIKLWVQWQLNTLPPSIAGKIDDQFQSVRHDAIEHIIHQRIVLNQIFCNCSNLEKKCLILRHTPIGYLEQGELVKVLGRDRVLVQTREPRMTPLKTIAQSLGLKSASQVRRLINSARRKVLTALRETSKRRLKAEN